MPAKSSVFVFNAYPQIASKISPAEEALVRMLFSNLNTAWAHPALQVRLKRARQRPSSHSILNSMTLFCAIWTASKPPEFQSYKVVWRAMRVHLENDGVLAALVSKFNAFVANNGKPPWKPTKSKEQWETCSMTPQKMEYTETSAEEGRGHHTRSSFMNSSDGVSSTYSLSGRTPPGNTNQGDERSSRPLSSYRPSPYLEFSNCDSYRNEEESYDQERFSYLSYSQQTDLHSHSLSSSSGVAWPQAQMIISEETYARSQMLSPAFADSYLHPTNGVQYEHKCSQLPEDYFLLPSPSLASPGDFSEALETQRNIAANSFHDNCEAQFPQLNTYPTSEQVYPLPCSSSPMTSYNFAYIPSRTVYSEGGYTRRGFCDREFGNKHTEGDAYDAYKHAECTGVWI
ncbi:hypothetical protein J3R30DRAFT_3406101 [Lentinula aciculospora]|uniref:Uncharacterized protein n=1 Tax=Lentinula aciculospora TaxID=153920 RepID=A0A9W9A5A9_9AGAR|nr:hypothetical protein J3R30DRAFT_3406101 [Lentinula aciculospora]